MDESTGEKLVMFGLLGLGAWWVYSTFFSGAAAVPASPAPGASPAGGTAAAGGGPASPSPAASSAPTPASYSGPSLAQMFAALKAKVATAYQNGETAVTCQQSFGTASNLSGFGAIEANAPSARTSAAATGGVSRVIAARSIPLTGGIVTNAPRVTAPAGCSTYSATYDVLNWYLTQTGMLGQTVTPDPPDHTSIVTLEQYWAWVSPLLQQQIQGLSGMGRWGLGHIGNIRAIVRGAA